MKALFLVILTVLLHCITSLNLYASKRRKSTALYARKHLAVRYGDALNNLKRENRYSDKLSETAARMELDLDAEQEEAISGADQRRKRIRDLKEVEAMQPDNIDYGTRTEKERNWTPDEIITAIMCLNLSYGINSEEFDEKEVDFFHDNDEERVGLGVSQ